MDDSIMDDSVFDMDDGASSDFAATAITKAKAPAKAPAAKKAAAAPKSKAAPKKSSQTTIKLPKATASKKRPKPDSSDEENSDLDLDDNSDNDNSQLSNTPPTAKKQKKLPGPKKSSGKPLASIENESFTAMDDDKPVPKPKAKAGVASDKYQKISHIEHILLRPDTYIGSVERTEQELWAYNSVTEAMEFRKVNFVPGLFKIFDEVLVNAADNKQNDKNMDEIKVTVDRETGEISVWNNGRGIPIEIHATEGIYIPEMIFGHLLSSSNYKDDEEKVTGGRNGYGAKLCNIYSQKFTVETADSRQKKRYKLTWTKNMSVKGTPSITQHKGEDYTKITFLPDYSKFKMEGMDDDFEALVKRRIFDLAGTLKGVKLKLNGERIKVTNFKKYMEMYAKALQADNSTEENPAEKPTIIVDNPHERWEIGFAVSDGAFKQVSFVNSIATTSGGTHVKHIADQVTTRLLELFKKKNKKSVTLKPHQIQSHMFLFLNCQIVNPAFTSQTKEQLTTKASQFGSKPQVTEKFLDQIAKSGVMTNIMHFADKKADQLLSKSDGSKRARMNNSKLTDANKAGTKDGWRCTLILTEGDSASGLALAGRAVVNPDLIGVFPLRGKLLNVRDASVTQISNNAEIQNIKKFMGLQHKKEYTDVKSLRYGHLMIMTDQDHDGSHIKGLLINFFEAQFPSLLKIPDFLNVFITPIVKVWKGDPKHPKQLKSFFTMPEYAAWKNEPNHQKGWDHKYYKGLGTSSTQDAEIYFRDLDLHLKEFEPMKTEEAEMIDLAFSKKKADARKNWLRDFVPGTFLDMSAKNISYDDFVNKELILFSMADNLRSIPSVVDGLKPSQRKVLYTCFKKNLKKDMKVVELSGMVSGLTNYSYGETSLQQTIVGLAQDFVGSNNINCLEPSGNFGSRRMGGNDAASARYIYTRLSPFARRIFNPADEALLAYDEDDGKTIEPHNYVPVVPLLLLNGANGIGTGWSTSIPNYKPEDIVDNLRRRMNGAKEDMLPMKPWFRSFNGTIEANGPDKWLSRGFIQQTGENEVEITELPIRMWTQDFKDKLEDIIKAEKTPSFIKDYTEYNTPTKVHFIIKMEDKQMAVALAKGLEEFFKLTTSMATSNLVAFDAQGRIHRYESVLDIMEEFYHVRLRFYDLRKQHLLGEMHKDLERLTNQARFIKMIIDGKLIISKKKKAVLMAELRKLNFKPFPKVEDASKAGEIERVAENNEEDEDDGSDGAVGARDYDYLLGMPIWSLTQERVDKILKQIGDKETEIDELNKLSSKDLWNRDLDEFLEEWHLQIDEEHKRAKKIAGISRRASAKLGIGIKGKKKRKAGSDSDDTDNSFVITKKKPAIKAVMDRAKTNPKGTSTLMGFFTKPQELVPPQAKPAPTAVVPAAKPKLTDPKPNVVDEDDFMDIDDVDIPVEKEVVAIKKSKATTAGASKPKPKPKVAEVSDEDDVFSAVAEEAKSRPAPARAVRAKKTKYVIDDEESGSDSGNDMLGDVSMMVKGLDGSTSASARPLFSATTQRPTSSHGLQKAIPKAKSKSVDSDDKIDNTDYHALIPQDSPRRPAPRTANETMISGEDDDEDEDDDMPIVKTKAAPKAKAKPAATKAATTKVTKPAPKTAVTNPAPVVKKVLPQSPAAKAYAKKQEQRRKVVPDDSDDDESEAEVNRIADEILSDNEGDTEMMENLPVAPIAANRGRRQASVQPKKYSVDSEDEEEDGESEEEVSEDYSEDESD
ncbi:type II DNA topoisomerase [Tothia fuscella]|uniref:DNA topoisomerase 2 n=1 Tax=Tothia fuscella TaxID=1048955 RepID=A0A9P4U0Y1_9PEZI|nr:type II DNA topoisomerase [Tothia fuscella]